MPKPGHSVLGHGQKQKNLVRAILPGSLIQRLKIKLYIRFRVHIQTSSPVDFFLRYLSMKESTKVSSVFVFPGDGLLCDTGALSFSLKVASMLEGNVSARSHISTSFLIFS